MDDKTLRQFIIISGVRWTSEISGFASRPMHAERPSSLTKVRTAISPLALPGILCVPAGARALVVFAHGSGSSRLSPRNTAVSDGLNTQGMATLLFDLLTPEEGTDRANVFDIPLLAGRVADTVDWISREPLTRDLRAGLFGASTGAAAALVAAHQLGDRIKAIVSRGGRPDLAGDVLDRIYTPTLLIVGGSDYGVIEVALAGIN
jgi:putative phosphoribosyl transferase